MSWVTIIWSMIASACFTMGGLHGLVWWRNRAARANLLFSLTALATAGAAACELWMMHAASAAEAGMALQWLHVPGWVIIVSLVGFVRLYLRAGRPWLAWAVCGVRTLSLVLNFAFTPNLNYREITALRHIRFLGESISVAEGVPNPWMLVGQASFLMLAAFVIDAMLTIWRRGDRRQARVLSSAIVLFVLAGTAQTVLVLWGIVHTPLMPSPFFLGVVAAMGLELSDAALGAAKLSDDLRESEARMSLAAEAAGVGVWMWDLASNKLWRSENWLGLFGFAPGTDVNFEMLIQRIHPDDRGALERAVLRTLKDRVDYAGEFRVVLPDGSQRWIASRGRMFPVTRGKPGRMLGAALDITERKRAEEALRESEARFRGVADTAPVMIWMSGTDKLCNFFNKGWLYFTGRSLEKEMGNGWAEGVHPDDLAGCMKDYSEAFGARRPFTIEYRLRRHDGEYRWISDTGVPRHDSERRFLGYIGSCVDLTERRRADERFRLAVEASPSGIVLVNDQGRMVLVNAQTENLFGYVREELIGQAVEMLVPERFRGAHPGHRAGFFAAPEARAMGAGRELFARRKDGTEFPVDIGLSPIQSAEGVLVLTAIVDITARKEAEAEALLQRAELVHVARVSTMGELAASVSHELNQPLGAILANAEAAELFINEDPPALDEVRAILTDIRKDDERAGEVIRRMRGLLRRHELDRQPLEINSVVEDVLQVVSADAALRKMGIGADLAPVLPKILGDRVYLQQVLLNLILNGMDAMADQPRERRRVVLHTRRSADGGVELAVIDGGHGIEPDKLPRLFEPFFTTKPNGMGMGLSISRTIIGAHRGRIWAENNPSGGAIFHITLPVIG